MGVAIRTLIATICLSLPIILCFCGCSQITPSTGITAPAVSDNFEESPMMITSFCFSHNGMSMADCYSYSITQDINSIRLQADLYAGNKTIDVVVDETVLENLGNIVSRHHLDQWNGFDKTNSMVLDGEGFSLSITLADENRITASGDNAFPKGYTDVKREICALFDALIDEYGNLYSKILVSDGLDYVMLNFTKRGGKHFFCSAGKKSDGTVSLDISIIDYEEFYPHESYQFLVAVWIFRLIRCSLLCVNMTFLHGTAGIKPQKTMMSANGSKSNLAMRAGSISAQWARSILTIMKMFDLNCFL